ncbi:MAG: hypothetical protein MJE68_12405, partial [Proteobacteria bacterium]|nr:hypothetical protein [Pseudomonadota bacterium]
YTPHDTALLPRVLHYSASLEVAFISVHPLSTQPNSLLKVVGVPGGPLRWHEAIHQQKINVNSKKDVNAARLSEPGVCEGYIRYMVPTKIKWQRKIAHDSILLLPGFVAEILKLEIDWIEVL